MSCSINSPMRVIQRSILLPSKETKKISTGTFCLQKMISNLANGFLCQMLTWHGSFIKTSFLKIDWEFVEIMHFLFILQEITADTEIEIPDMSVAKQLMRKHIRGLLNILSLKERRIIRLRFGIEDGKQKSLSEIGNVFGLSKERVRQLESRALYKLKQCVGSHGLDAYADLLRWKSLRQIPFKWMSCRPGMVFQCHKYRLPVFGRWRSCIFIGTGQVYASMF